MTDATSEAELAVIGICATWPEWLEVLDLRPSHFSSLHWREIYDALLTLRQRGEGIEAQTVQRELERRDKDGLTGELMAALAEAPPTGDNAEHLASLVRDGHVRRSVAQVVSRVERLYRDGGSGGELLSDALRQLSEVDAGQGDSGASIGELIQERAAELDEIAAARQRGDTTMTGIPSGISELDGLLGGIQPGIVTVVAGRPGMGKSAFGMTLSDHASAGGYGVHVFSLEDTRAAYCDRAMARAADVAGESIRSLDVSVEQLEQIKRASRELIERPGWYVDDRSGITADEIVRSVRRKRRENGTRLVLVDYVQLVRGHKGEDRQLAIANAMTAFADAAKADGMSYVVFSQLNRRCEYRDDKRPLLSDLREAGEIEEYSKCVLFLFRPAVYHSDAPANLVEIIARKNNHGRTGTVEATWHGPTTRVS